MNLTEQSEIFIWPKTHYVFIEKTGLFADTAPQAWQAAHQIKDEIIKQNCKILGAMSLYKVEPHLIYRAGFIIDVKPIALSKNFQYLEFLGGKYLKFTLTGSYVNLPEACARAMSIVEKNNRPLRDDFYIEHYVGDPHTTSEDKLITEILIPIK